MPVLLSGSLYLLILIICLCVGAKDSAPLCGHITAPRHVNAPSNYIWQITCHSTVQEVMTRKSIDTLEEEKRQWTEAEIKAKQKATGRSRPGLIIAAAWPNNQ